LIDIIINRVKIEMLVYMCIIENVDLLSFD